MNVAMKGLSGWITAIYYKHSPFLVNERLKAARNLFKRDAIKKIYFAFLSKLYFERSSFTIELRISGWSGFSIPSFIQWIINLGNHNF